MKRYLPFILSAMLALGAHGVAGEKKNPELDVNLPPKNASVVKIQADGALQMGCQKIADADFQKEIEKLVRKDPDAALILRGDAETPYTHIARVLDICNKAGLWNLSMPVSK
jgi:biopolymer transport protein ExbD